MLEAQKGSLHKVRIYDYADTQYRGVIEGYYGVPYSKEVTEDLFRFMARYKMNTYMYGAKSDPYHSRYWEKPYPTSITQKEKGIGYLSQDMLRSMTDVAHQCKVNFIWAIHPGQAFTDATQADVLDKVMSKFADMHRLGVRQFGVFVDDVGVPDDAAMLKLGADRLTTPPAAHRPEVEYEEGPCRRHREAPTLCATALRLLVGEGRTGQKVL
jgi:hyaluronoglucosaminidase